MVNPYNNRGFFNMKSRLLALLIVILSCGSYVSAQEFFDTSNAPNFFSMGARIGFNTSNRTFPSGAFSVWTNNSWGTGFNIGAVANLNFKEYLSLQPGIFFESRSGNYAYLTEYLDVLNVEQTFYQVGHLRTYNFTIPILGIAKFNIAQNIKWLVEFGPYFQFKLGSTGLDNIRIPYRPAQSNLYDYYTASPTSFDFGFKMGTGLKFLQHYYVGVHYLAGALKTWKNPSGGKNKSWEFTLGYDF